ncbi:unnamed protein product [Durusdinium trenchii]|uniref:Uncharacterized protein n=1 Tax=Durusdinium trenchii TaxID=1381693 RepID=A0ABP0MN05_9DINO
MHLGFHVFSPKSKVAPNHVVKHTRVVDIVFVCSSQMAHNGPRAIVAANHASSLKLPSADEEAEHAEEDDGMTTFLNRPINDELVLWSLEDKQYIGLVGLTTRMERVSRFVACQHGWTDCVPCEWCAPGLTPGAPPEFEERATWTVLDPFALPAWCGHSFKTHWQRLRRSKLEENHDEDRPTSCLPFPNLKSLINFIYDPDSGRRSDLRNIRRRFLLQADVAQKLVTGYERVPSQQRLLFQCVQGGEGVVVDIGSEECPNHGGEIDVFFHYTSADRFWNFIRNSDFRSVVSKEGWYGEGTYLTRKEPAEFVSKKHISWNNWAAPAETVVLDPNADSLLESGKVDYALTFVVTRLGAEGVIRRISLDEKAPAGVGPRIAQERPLSELHRPDVVSRNQDETSDQWLLPSQLR